MRRLDAGAKGFPESLAALRLVTGAHAADVSGAVAGIIADVRVRGDDALVEYTNRFDRRAVHSVSELEVPHAACAAAWERIPGDLRAALRAAAARIEDFHRRQLRDSWQYEDGDGNLLGQRVIALDRVGIYVPGGKASYPSSVLMNAIPARVAGVTEVVMAVPAPGG